jgi:hypothetical protein
MESMMCRLRVYGRISLALVVLLLFFAGCSDNTDKAPQQKISQQESFALPKETNDLDFGVEQVINSDNGFIKVNGWAAVRNLDSKNSIIYCVLKSKDKTYIFDNLHLYKRPDVTAHFKIDRDESGFNAVIPADKLEKGEYRIGIIIKKNNADHFQFTDKKVTV